MDDEEHRSAADGPRRPVRRRRDAERPVPQAQLFPVLLGIGGALVALLIGMLASSPSSPTPAASALSSSAKTGAGASRSNPPSQAVTSTTRSQSSGSGSTTTSAAAPLGTPPPCTPTEVTITTTTDKSSYSSGKPVTIVTKLVSNAACDLELVPSGQYECGESVVVDTWSGQQAYPMLGQGEQCGSLPKGAVTPGTAESATVVWNPKASAPSVGGAAAQPNRYQAVGSWSWSDGSDKPAFEVAVDSAPFSVAP